MSPMLRDSSIKGRGYALSQVARDGQKNKQIEGTMGYSIRTARYRYTLWAKGENGHELYDYETDPLERVNLVDKAEHADTVAALRKQLDDVIASSRPPSGNIPQVGPNDWAPNLTNP